MAHVRSRPPASAPHAPQHAAEDPAQLARTAFAAGDFARARALGATLLARAKEGQVVLPAALAHELQARQRALALDPYVLQVGAATLVLYAAAWAYALLQHG